MPYGYKNTSVSLDAQLFTGTSEGIRIFLGMTCARQLKILSRKKLRTYYLVEKKMCRRFPLALFRCTYPLSMNVLSFGRNNFEYFLHMNFIKILVVDF